MFFAFFDTFTSSRFPSLFPGLIQKQRSSWPSTAQKKEPDHSDSFFYFDVPSKLHTNFFISNLLPFPTLTFWSSPRPISSSQLHALRHFHPCPINLVVFKGSYSYDGISHLEGGFTLRCLQRLSRPDLATRLCTWQCNRYTRGQSIPVLSY